MTFALIPALVVVALAAAQSASAATLSPTPTVSTGSAVNIGSGAATGDTQAPANEVLTGTATTVSGGSNGGLCLGNGPSSGYVSFNAVGPATGASPGVPAPYPGTFTQTNASASLYRSAGQKQVKLSIPFTISSSTATINGTITNPSPYAGGGQFLCGNFYIFGIGVTTNTANYMATIQGPNRPTQTVSGNAQVSVSLQFRPYRRLYTSPITATLLNFPSP